MGKGKIPAVGAPVLLHSPLGYFGSQMPLVVSGFPSFNLLDDIVNQCQTQGRVPAGSVHDGFDLGGAFAFSGKPCIEVVHFRHIGSWEGRWKQIVS
jgi:hypothetical protein